MELRVRIGWRLAAALGLAACAFLGVFLAGQGLVRAGLWATVLGLPVAVVAAVAGVRAAAGPARPGVLPPPKLEVPEWAVSRPAEVAAVITVLLSGRSTAGITTGLHGAGGFGKTTLALMVCADRRVRRQFSGGVHWVTLGRDVRGAPAVVAKVNDVIKAVAGEDATFTDPGLAGARLAALLGAGPRRLLVLDDVWDAEQLAPFAVAGRRCARLVTTRVSGLLVAPDTAVLVDQMSADQARRLLLSDAPGLDPAVAQGLLAVTGRWPLLLRLSGKILADAAATGMNVDSAGGQLLQRLRSGGPAVVDDLLGHASVLDVAQPAERAQAVRATISASMTLLSLPDVQRFTELGVFAEDETIPFSMIARLWQATAGLETLAAARLCARLRGLALVSLTPAGTSSADSPGGVTLHDVLRDFLRAELGPRSLAQLSSVLLDAAAESLPAAVPLSGNEAGGAGVAWWAMDSSDHYLRGHLVEHLLEAGRSAEAEAVVSDLRWAGPRVRDFGPAHFAADLARVGTPQATRLQSVLVRSAHLLAPTRPPESVVDILHGRIADDPDWGSQAAALAQRRTQPRLVSASPLPDLPDPALRRVLSGHVDDVTALVASPDGTWLASGSADGTARVWDPATWQERAALTGQRGEDSTLAVTPDGRWLAVSSASKTRIWDTTTWQEHAALAGHSNDLHEIAVVFAPNGQWLASGSANGITKIWDTATWQERAALPGCGSSLYGMAVVFAPDSRWLATAALMLERTVHIWDTATWQERTTPTGYDKEINDVTVALDGRWLAVASGNTVHILDTATWQEQTKLTGRGFSRYLHLAAAPDGNWLAVADGDKIHIWDTVTWQEKSALTTSGTRLLSVVTTASGDTWLTIGDGPVRIWNTATWQERAGLTGHKDRVRVVRAAPDGTWIAVGSKDGAVRIWDTAALQQRTAVADREPSAHVAAIAPGRRWLAISGDTVRICDTVTGKERAVLAGHPSGVSKIAVAPDGSWLATGSNDETVRVWDTSSWIERGTLTGHSPCVTSMAVSPEGTWLAVANPRGTIWIWETTTWRQRGILDGGYAYRASWMTVAPDGSWLATASDQDGKNKVRIWDTNRLRKQAVLTSDRHGLGAMTVAPDGRWLAVGSASGQIRIWDTATWRRQLTFDDHATMAAGARMLPARAWRAAARLWHRAQLIREIFASGETRALLMRRVTEMIVAPDGSWLAVCMGFAGTVRIWDTATWYERAPLTGLTRPTDMNAHGANVNLSGLHIAMDVAPNSRWLATSTGDGTIRIWDMATRQELAVTRIDDTINTCHWTGEASIAIGGARGIYIFDFVDGRAHADLGE